MKLFIFVIVLLFSSQIFTEYSEKEALKYWRLCKMSYCSYDLLSSLTCGEICSNFKPQMEDLKLVYKENTHLLAYTFFDNIDNSMYLVYRGTDNIPNWFQDFEAVRVDYDKCEGCTVHQGFLENTHQLIGEIKANLKQMSQKRSTKKLIITGHSLGAALAYLGAAELYREYSIEKLYTFGCPRMGNDKFARWFDSIKFPETYRIVNENDIVTHSPGKFLGYNHVNTEVWYYETKNLKYKTCPKNEDPKCSDSLWLFSMIAHGGYMNDSCISNTHLNEQCNPIRHYHP